jgi:8-oxo-dGTP diphosphatase
MSVKASIKDTDGKILLLKESDGSWELPGGGLEHGENPREALSREIAEETGLTVDWMSEQPETLWTIYKEVGSPTLKWFAFVVYQARVSGVFRPDPIGSEAQEAKYYSIDDAKKLNLHGNTKPYFA